MVQRHCFEAPCWIRVEYWTIRPFEWSRWWSEWTQRGVMAKLRGWQGPSQPPQTMELMRSGRTLAWDTSIGTVQWCSLAVAQDTGLDHHHGTLALTQAMLVDRVLVSLQTIELMRSRHSETLAWFRTQWTYRDIETEAWIWYRLLQSSNVLMFQWHNLPMVQHSNGPMFQLSNFSML